ncbi:hypothetical protein [Paraburkholderia sp. GAS32]|uniref:hypothetical protein n=1 Tax=Paraburkholderia sp. GAS32 TaxID=3035129 RepID=UPI003D1F9E7D
MEILTWISSHWDWLFGGVGGTAAVAAVGWLFSRSSGNNQKQAAGDDSVNIQAGRDANVKGISNKKREQ